MGRLLFTAALALMAWAAPQSARWERAEEWEDPDLAVFFTGELRGYVEPCG